MSKAISIFIITILGILFFGLTLRGSLGNFTQINDLKKLERQVGSPFESSHERASYVELLRMREANTPVLTEAQRDFAAPDVGFNEGKYYSYFPPGVSTLMRPFFELGYPFQASLLTSYASMAVLAILTMIFIYLICRNVFQLPSYAGIAAAVIYGFATTSWSYSITIFQHAPAAFFATIMFYGVSRYRARVKTSALWASIVWFTYGISISFDYPNGLILAPFIVYYLTSTLSVWRDEHRLKFNVNAAHLSVGIWFAIAVAIHLMFNLLYMDSAFSLRQNYDRYDPGLSRMMLEENTKNKVKPVTTEPLPEAVEQRTRMPFLEEVTISGFVTLLVAPDKGLLFFSPILVFGLWGLFLGFRRGRAAEHSVILSFIVLNILIYASFGDPYGGWAFGPRYLIPTMAALAIYAGYAFYHLRNPIVKLLFYSAFLFSLSIAAAGALTSNNVPPQVEATPLGRPYYNYLLNFHLIETNQTANFVYNTYLRKHMRLSDFYVLIVFSLGLFMYVVLFATPLFNKGKK